MVAEHVVTDCLGILRRLVKSNEFAVEIQRLALDPWAVPINVVKEAALVARARAQYEPIADLHDQIHAHKQIQPKAWPASWQPSTHQTHLLMSAALSLLATFLVGPLVGDLLWAPLSVVLPLALFGTSITLLLLGLPRSVRQWLWWGQEHLRLAAGLPTRRWESRRRLRDEVLIPELRGWLDAQASPTFSTTLELRNTRGLMMPAGQGPLVSADAVRGCTREINRGMPAAIGIAGTRGVGKTTIIERAVRNDLTDPERAPVLGVMTTAPVRYDARDFVLHVHASACRAVLDELSTVEGTRSSESQRLWARRFRLYRLRSAVVSWLFALGGVGLVVTVAAAVAVLTWGWHGDRGEETMRRATAFEKDLVTRTRAVLETAPLQVFAVAAIVVMALVALWITLKSLVPPLFNSLHLVTAALLNWLAHRSSAEEAALRAVARQHLRRIRFLQTRTSGWSGKVAGIGGLELVPTRSTANAEQPLTYPEVVERLREFLELVGDVLITRTGRLSALVIAIDELDKIADPDEAHNFLNDVKGIFGVRHCVYLISVSEDALAAFERRGMPARDAFDSAFTSMVPVDPFTLSESQRWLAHRALGIPKPFVWLCHCLSGGLPRDLARVAIAVHDLSDTQHTLGDFTRAIVTADLDVKRQAFVHAARQLADQGSTIHALIEFLLALSATRCTNLVDGTAWQQPLDGDTDTPLARLWSEVRCYVAFCATLLEVFTDDIGEHLDLRSPSSGSLSTVELLADVRRRMSVNTPLAALALADFRTGLSSFGSVPGCVINFRDLGTGADRLFAIMVGV
ncbi:hypothetical protein [Actinophytocola sp.]|uniref:hypothetical protein n=1 Tax=Actinophytocola sp. TaxID=1872138 RepID=UPI00389ACCAE